MKTKVVKKGQESGKWKDTGIYWKAKGKLFYFERAINTIYWCNESCFVGNQFDSSEFDQIGRYTQAIGSKFENENEMIKSKEMISREEFCKSYNMQSMKLHTTFDV